MLARKGEAMPQPERTGVSLVGKLQWEGEKARRAALESGPAVIPTVTAPKNHAPVVEQSARVQPVADPPEGEHERVVKIFSSAEAEGRAALAYHLAAETNTHSRVAIGYLRLAPRWESKGQADPVERLLMGMSLEERVSDALQARARVRAREDQAAEDASSERVLKELLASLPPRKGEVKP